MVTFKTRKFNPIVSFNDVEVDVSSLPDRSITVEQYKTVRANSDGFSALHCKLDNECLRYVVAHYLNNSRRESATTYDYALKNDIIPELLKRLEE
ncbi:hypothetical protein NV379_02070 [Paenibacillus sp. N1-5-1-14]|uniref:hypothetical protein n=1 Tax=Paenibacillus radicibacter TaxID=2972488 RepID=UPI0021596FF7|nr:hypothetical protein [Paenibacillus radicibacter]MCR8641432.1 hypothetical protein [Paenibacillus radicibacter]